MNFRPMLIANGALVAFMAGVSAWFWNAIPEGAQIPVHWNLQGEVDRYGSKEEALLFVPLLALGITALMWFLPRLDPRRANIEASGKFWTAATVGVVAFMAYMHTLLALAASGMKIDIMSALIPGMAALFIALGNYLGKTRSNWFGGVRTPWTMSSDYSWEKTHRWTGRLFVVTGLAAIAVWLVADPWIAFIVMIGGVLGSVVAGIVMSYIFWRDDPDRQADANGHGA